MFRSVSKGLFLATALGLFASSALGQSNQTIVTGTEGNPFGRIGFYAGLDAGSVYNGGVNNWTVNQIGAAASQAVASNANGSAFTGGIYGGWQWIPVNVPNIVIGPEISFDYVANASKNTNIMFNNPAGGIAPAGTYLLERTKSTNFLGAVVGHLGYLFYDNLAQVYVAGGFAYGGNSGAGSGTVVYTSPTGQVTQFAKGTTSGTKTGSEVGGGFMYAFPPSLAVKVEFMYVELNSNSHTFYPPSGGGYFFSNNATAHFSIIRAGMQWHF